MSNTTAVAPMQHIKSLMNSDSIKAKFAELLGNKSAGFITGVLQVVSNNKLLEKASPNSIYNAAATAAILDLPINNSLGFAYIVPYGSDAQFQLGYKGLIQLAQRTGKYKAINATPVYENQFKSFNALTEELDADFTKSGEGKVVGYAAYFKLVNGFEKTSYWPIEKVNAHGKRFSKSFNSGPWKSDFDAMACKTILKQSLSKYGPLSIEMERAIISDQAVIRDVDSMEVSYPDNGSDVTAADEQVSEEFINAVAKAQTQDDFDIIGDSFEEASTEVGKRYLNARKAELNA
jgi:recombination protein RecT